MKCVLLCEGRNDNVFIAEMFNKIGLRKEHIKLFDHRECDKKKDLKYKQAKIVRSFEEPYSPYLWLAKSEAGKLKAEATLIRHWELCLRHHLVLMVDFDGKPLAKAVTRLQKKIDGRQRGEPVKLQHSLIKETKILCLAKLVVLVGQQTEKVGSFHLVAFKRSLEDEIKRLPNATGKSKIDLILDLTSDSEIAELFKLVLLNPATAKVLGTKLRGNICWN